MQRRYRLRQPVVLQQLRRQGQRWSHPLAVLIVQRNDEELSRFAFAANRRVGKAVARNRAKRLLRESVRGHVGEIEAGRDYLFLAREATAKASYAEVEAAVLGLLKRARLLRQEKGTPGNSEELVGTEEKENH
jgi:ribonuclease P protein component